MTRYLNAAACALMPLLLPLACWAQAAPDLTGSEPAANSIWLDSMNLNPVEQDFGSAQAGRSVDRNPITLHGQTYAHGVGTHANSVIAVELDGAGLRFTSMVGVDDEKGRQGSVTFTVFGDGKDLADSGVMRGGDPPKLISVDIAGVKRLRLAVGDAGDGIDSDHADWAGAQIALAPGAAAKPQIVPDQEMPLEPPRMTIPAPDPLPAIHGPSIVGAAPGKPFLFRIPATGSAPLRFAAKSLPAGITLDPVTGILSGRLKTAGRTTSALTVSNALGKTSRSLVIVAGDGKLALTPPMGWNSWNVWARNVTQQRVADAADAFISSGLAAHGYQYVNIDDTWEGDRNAQGEITTNAKFPDMAGLAAYVHSRGLKLGIYSSPGPTTCAGYPASYQHEQQDASTYAAWGVDYLKYDWCSYAKIARGMGLDELKKPYALMSAALRATSRDIVFSLCQYGMGQVWTWGASVGGNCWRTTSDIRDSWQSLHGIYESQNGHEKYAGPGHWNDPDMLVVGEVGWGRTHPSNLTPNEQILHITLWSLFSAPLLIGCDLSSIDAFTKAILTNDEVIDIDQDPLGKPAGKIAMSGDVEIWARPLADGSEAVGLINPTKADAPGAVSFSELGLPGRRAVRDLWLHKDVGRCDGSYTVIVPAHGAVLVKVR